MSKEFKVASGIVLVNAGMSIYSLITDPGVPSTLLGLLSVVMLGLCLYLGSGDKVE